MITGLLIGLAIAILAKRSVGVGKLHRNIYKEIEYCQSAGVDFSQELPELSQYYIFEDAMRRFGWQPGRSFDSRKDNAVELYYQQLRRTYKKATAPIGAVHYPYVESTIRNKNGDVALIHRHYDPEADMMDALAWWYDNMPRDGYRTTVYNIATGTKFLWKGKEKGGVLISRGIADELFFSKTNLEGERRLYKGITSSKGVSIDQAADAISLTDSSVRNEVLEALREFPRKQDARNYILQSYYDTFNYPDEEPSEYDTPF